jgi:hypothetical protein
MERPALLFGFNKQPTYLLTPWSRVFLEKLTSFQLVKKFATRRFITAFTSVRHLSLSWAKSIQSTPKLSVQVRGLLFAVSQHDTFLCWGVVSASPNPQTGGPPLVGSPRLLIHYIRKYPPYWRLFLHPQPEDALCHGERDPRNTMCVCIYIPGADKSLARPSSLSIVFFSPGNRW